MTVVDLGAYGGAPQYADINDAGQVAITGGAAGYLWQNGVASELAGSEWAKAINTSGEVLMTPYGNPPNTDLIWASGSTRPLSGFDLTGVNMVWGADINDHDAVAGGVTPSAAGFGPTFLWDDGSIQWITPAGVYSLVTALNNNDQVVGYHQVGQTTAAFVWQNGALTDLPALATSCTYGPGQGEALGINDAGVIVGATLGSGPRCTDSAVVWQGGSVTELPKLSGSDDHYFARAINQQGVIVGEADRSNSQEPWAHEAVQWVGGQIEALPGLGGLNSIAYAINSNGVVAGYADDAAGVWHAVLWNPSSVSPQAQTISFGSLSSVTYGQAPVNLVATASSGLPVSFVAAGSCTVSGATLSIVGAGTCSVTATQAGNIAWLPAAPVTQGFSISQSQLLVTPDSLTKVVKAANPTLTAKLSGFVNGESLATSGVSGTPACSTKATASSGVGSYPINCTRGTLAATNYGFTFATGSLKVVYGFKGFLQPINDTTHSTCGSTCSMSIFKAGSVIPVSFKLYDAGNHEIKANSLPVWGTPVKVGTTTQKVNECVSRETASTGTKFKLDGSTYYYNWSTKGLAAGSVYTISATLDDGTVQSVVIGLN
jgi:probable HAF family extracellular repeat protein